MNMPNLMPMQLSQGEPTDPYQSGGASPGGPAGRINVALVAGSGPHLTSEIETLLRKRLLIFALIAFAVAAIYAVYSAPLWMRGQALFGRIWLDLAYACFSLAWQGALAAILWRRRTLSLAWLRAIELMLFGGAIVLCALFIYVPTRLGALAKYDYLGEDGGWAVGSALSLPGFATLVAYGIFIPNTWRRCAVVVAVMALCPLVVSVAAMAQAEQAIDRDLRITFLENMTVWMAIGATLAVCGSYRISVLQREASEARKLGQYRLKERLGSGGMGEVYLAEPLLLRRPCAIKLIRPERAGDPNILRRFEREVQATATLTHPNTVQIFDYGHAEDGTFYYVMEYLPGLSLEELVKQHGPLPPERAVHFLRQVCGALREAHAIGLIHRDIKSSNVLVCERGGLHDVAKLVDFGLVRAPGASADGANLTLEGAIAGTPAYMSPEQAGGQENLDARSDIYSLGAVAYFLLTGQPPFAGRSPVKVVAAHIYEPPTPLSNHRSDVSEDLQQLVLRCLAKNPADRFADAESLEIALGACHTTGPWCEKQAADWWRSRAGPSVAVASDNGNSDGRLTRR
jgi:eukaryotic-like serine/threonine-protein kinase